MSATEKINRFVEEKDEEKFIKNILETQKYF
jgi:hypothetical protein